ncbi:MAG: hypothetical protein H6P95_1898, partial [Candidatus Aminicenantes bacterium]|nr:hypothetical protein [Candidatus Aminicenantes bacterium]
MGYNLSGSAMKTKDIEKARAAAIVLLRKARIAVTRSERET